MKRRSNKVINCKHTKGYTLPKQKDIARRRPIGMEVLDRPLYDHKAMSNNILFGCDLTRVKCVPCSGCW
jgi:hypothetical protein